MLKAIMGIGHSRQSIDTTRPNLKLYVPLQGPSAKIRLFRIIHKAIGSNRAIKGLLEVVDLENSPPFLAFSYVWGSPCNQEMIYINGEPFNVRRNLFNFLQRFKSLDAPQHEIMFPAFHTAAESTHPVYIWIDQICIDQNNVDERNSQVHLMSDIYKKASQVLSWLGDGNPMSAGTLRIMQGNAATYQSQLGNVPILNSLEHDPYFTRLWIVQELLLANDVTFMCSESYLRWDRLVEWDDYILTNTTLRGNSGYQIIAQFITRRKLRTRFVATTFDEVLAEFCSNKCTDPRDKVYGLCGLVSGVRDWERPQPNYKNTTVRVYVEAVKAVAKTWVAISGRDDRFEFESFVSPPSRYIPEASLQKLLKEMGIDLGDISELTSKDYENLKEYLDDVWDEATQALEEYRAANPLPHWSKRVSTSEEGR